MIENFKIKLVIWLIVVLVVLAGIAFIFRGQIQNVILDKAQNEIIALRLNKAETYLNMARKLNKNSGHYHFLAGNIALLQKNDNEAISHYADALGLNYNPTQVLGYRAASYINKKEYNKAIDDYISILKISPGDSLASQRLSFIYFQLGRFKESADILKGVVDSIRPDNLKAESYGFLGRAYYLSGSYKESAEAYKKSLELSPNQPLVLVRLARTLRDIGDYSGAIDEINKALKINPDYKPAFCTLSGVYNKIGEYNKSIEVAKKGSEGGTINSANILCLYNAGVANYSKDSLVEAKSNFEKFLSEIQSLNLQSSEDKKLESQAKEFLSKIK